MLLSVDWIDDLRSVNQAPSCPAKSISTALPWLLASPYITGLTSFTFPSAMSSLASTLAAPLRLPAPEDRPDSP